ncbi:MAG: DUF3990 domain-containing protein [Mogibacterium sp.]|nr:DUF3990 domain-containing protein [Mogibacterium sp.]MBR2541180.1 DUF3990 domain-containing protein [Mogibacterium sp.]
MIRTIYYGSPNIIRTPTFGSGNPYNDFGLGFYCTDNPVLAREWAVSRNHNGFVSKYSLNDAGLRIIDLGSPQYGILHWISVLASYREFDTPTSLAYQGKEYVRSTFSVDYQNTDCLIGYRADNSNFMFAQDFLNGLITYEQLRDAVKLGNTGRQFVLKSNRAFDRIVYEGYEPAYYSEIFPGKVTRDLNAVRKASGDSHGMYIEQILDEGIQPYDPRLG